MQIAASQLRANDLIRGIGIVVTEASYDEVTNETVVYGHVGRDPEALYSTQVALPGPHRVNVRREFQVGDLVTIANPEYVDPIWEDTDEVPTVDEYLRRTVTFVDPESRQVYTVPEGAPLEADGDVLAVGFNQARFVLV